MGIFRPTTAEIHLEAFRSNYKKLRELLPPNVRVMAMVKADAYGHGAVEVSKVLADCGVAALGVATVEEGIELRSANVTAPILVLGGLMGVGSAAAGMIIGADLIPVVHSAGVLESLEAISASAGKVTGIHLKIDTGMTRLGVMPHALPNFLDKLKACAHLRLDGVMTHFADSDNEEYTDEQINLFKECVKTTQSIIGNVPVWHIANSRAILDKHFLVNSQASEHWVRPGLILYGGAGFAPVMHLKSKVAMIKSVPAGTKISYGCTFETKRQSIIGVVPIGYADGYPWALSNKAQVLIGGERAPVVGSVTMDMTMIDITDIKEAKTGDEVVLMGNQNKDVITVEEISAWAGTIPYEILCGISKRTPRVYL